jgi:hypothetical protein
MAALPSPPPQAMPLTDAAGNQIGHLTGFSVVQDAEKGRHLEVTAWVLTGWPPEYVIVSGSIPFAPGWTLVMDPPREKK